MARRGVAAVGVLIVVILLVLLFRGCLDARKENSMEDYANRSAELMQESKDLGTQLFDLLQSEGGTDQVVEIQNDLNAYRVSAASIVERARDLDVPGDLSDANRYFLDVLEFRSDAFTRTVDAMRTALGDQDRREGTEDVTEAMQVFLASDTIDQIRFRPLLREALEAEDLTVPAFPGQPFVPDVEWLDAGFVSDQVNGLRSGTGGAAGDEDAAPGLHGNGIAAVSLGGTTLTVGGTATVQLTSDLAFEIQVQNQGENTETDVNVVVTVGEGDDAIELEEAIDTIAVGEIQTVTIPLSEQPPTGQSIPITVEVEPVAGEEMTDNNVQEFAAIFTR